MPNVATAPAWRAPSSSSTKFHRFNKAQQDAVLHAVEDGVVTLIGATTENPSFEVVAPLLSRTRVFKLEPAHPPPICASSWSAP